MNKIDCLKNSIEKNISLAEDILQKAVNINSFSKNKEGTDKVGSLFRNIFEPLGFETTTFPMEEVGDVLLFSNTNESNYILFLAHLDTVFPPDKAIPYKKDGNTYYGNGVTDDKGGCVISFLVVKALEECGYLKNIPIKILFNTDEEIGSMQSKRIIEDVSSNAKLVLVVEYGKPRPDGATVVTRRLGRGRLEVTLRGKKASTAALQIIEDAYYLASPEDRRVIRVKDYVSSEDHAYMIISFGFPDDAEGDYMHLTLRKLVEETSYDMGVDFLIDGGKTRPPLIFGPSHLDMYEKMVEIGKSLSFKIYPEHRTSCSDGSFVPVWVPVLDGVGPIGNEVHTEREYMLKESLTIRPLILAELITSLF